MALRMFQALSRRQPRLPEIDPVMVKANLRKAEQWAPLGRAIERVRILQQLSLKEFADALSTQEHARDERQVARWIAARERPQLEVVFAVPAFRRSVVIALAEQVHDVSVETVIRSRSEGR